MIGLWVLLGLVVALGVYYYGVHVGLKAGLEIGRKRADVEWQAIL